MATSYLYEEMVLAGFGGQGILLVGKLLAQTAMRAGLEVSYMASYGAEVRGGTANCMVVVSNRPIACPMVNAPNSLVICNKASLSKFAPRLRPGGLLIFNSSLIQNVHSVPDGVQIIGIPAEEIALEAGSVKSANMVMLGAYLGKRGHLSPEQAAEALPDVLAQRHHKTIPVNTQALRGGADYARSHA
ncbi:MAG TPA: 2-oxoacid:acceptor oxidoreductase family protein [Sedimentisphaerales bacterium]|jgi:2-oxoglutarate ferredoxin oxidoreductase subunit gamma|nr:2-oxoacid:acceptor oxidoreductase family protein [Sedimentisphaerales bacterium]HNU27875.1 2-oxoacid:acceptor oxidoreductase family protein [Sedimentisphaerales bacterium]